MPSDFNSPLSAIVPLWLGCRRDMREGEREREKIRGDLRCFEMAIVLNGEGLYEWLIYFRGPWHLVWVWPASCFGNVNPLTSRPSMLTRTRTKVQGQTHVGWEIMPLLCFQGNVDSGYQSMSSYWTSPHVPSFYVSIVPSVMINVQTTTADWTAKPDVVGVPRLKKCAGQSQYCFHRTFNCRLIPRSRTPLNPSFFLFP